MELTSLPSLRSSLRMKTLPTTLFCWSKRKPPRSTLFPYTTLFRSRPRAAARTRRTRPRSPRARRRSRGPDRKSTRLNSSHVKNSYAVFCLKKKKAAHADIGAEHEERAVREVRNAHQTENQREHGGE